MSTAFKQVSQKLDDLKSKLDQQASLKVNPENSAIQWQAAVKETLDALEELGRTVNKMVAKAKEPNPDKQVYGKSMSTKVLDLGNRFSQVKQRAEGLRTRISPLADAEKEAAEALSKATAEAEASRRQAEVKAEAEAMAEALKAEAEAKAGAEALRAQAEAKAEALKVEAEAKAGAEARRAAEEAKPKEAAKAEAETRASIQREAERAARALAAAAAPSSPQMPAGEPFPGSQSLAGKVIKVDGGTDELKQIFAHAGKNRLVVVDFSASWCGPCRAIAPFLEQLAAQYSSTCLFVALDATGSEANRALAKESGISAFPTFHFYRDRQRIDEMKGANREGLRAKIQRLITGGGADSQRPGTMTDSLVSSLQVLKGSCSFEDFCAASRTLLTFVSNVLAHPGDSRYKRVRMSNPRFSTLLGSRRGGVACMEAVGFRKVQEGNEWVMVMEQVAPDLPQIKSLLEDALRQTAVGHPAPRAGPAGSTAGLPGSDPPGVLPGFGSSAGLSMPGPRMQQAVNDPQAAMQAALQMIQTPGVVESMQRALQPGQGLQGAQAMMNDPQMMQAAMQMMQNPAMVQSMQQLLGGAVQGPGRQGAGAFAAGTTSDQQVLQNPALMADLQGLQGGGQQGRGPAARQGGAAGMSRMMSDPQMVQAAMQLMQNPGMMESVQQFLGGGQSGQGLRAGAAGTTRMANDPQALQAAMQMLQNPAMTEALQQLLPGGLMGQERPARQGQYGAPTPPGNQATEPISQSAAQAPPSQAAASTGDDMDEMTEEEMLQLALQRSLEENREGHT